MKRFKNNPFKIGSKIPFKYVKDFINVDWEHYFLFGNVVETEQEKFELYRKYVLGKITRTNRRQRIESIAPTHKFYKDSKKSFNIERQF